MTAQGGINIRSRSPISTNAQNVNNIKTIDRMRAGSNLEAETQLTDLLDCFQKWRDNLPASLESSATAEALDAVQELRSHVEDLQAVDLPKGFGRH
jgi:hypothetical protein